MPTAVESYSNIGAVVVQLPAAPPISIEPNAGLGGRNSHILELQTAHYGPSNPVDGPIGGRSGIGSAILHNPHLAAHVLRAAPHKPVHFPSPNDSGIIGGRSGTGAVTPHVNHSAPLLHNTATHHPPVHAPLNGEGPIGGRSGIGAFTPHVSHATPLLHNTPTHHHPVHQSLTGDRPIGGRTDLLPAVQHNHVSNRTVNIEPTALQHLLPQINAALQAVIPQAHHTLEAIGVGTDAHTLGILIGLLRTQGYHVTVASCDGPERRGFRTGFTGPIAILRGHGGATVGQFLQQVASARLGHS